MKHRRNAGRVVTYLYLAILYFPIYWMFTMAFKERVDILSIPPKLLFVPVLSNFEYVFRQSNILHAVVRSLWISVIAVTLSVIVASFAAYALARFKWRRGRDLEFFIMSTRMLPPVAVILPYYSIFIRLNLLDDAFALAFVYLLIALPLVIWLLLGFFRTIPQEIDDAARLDGCGHLAVFLRIELPIIQSGIATSAMLAFLFTWGELFFAFILTSVNNTYPVALLSFLSVGFEVQYGPMAAAGVIAVIPAVILALIGRRYLIAGFRSLAGVS